MRNENVHDIVWDQAIATAPFGTVATRGGESFPVMYFTHETIDTFSALNVDFPLSKFRPGSFFERIRAAGGAHIKRSLRTRVAVIKEGQIAFFDTTEVIINATPNPSAVTVRK